MSADHRVFELSAGLLAEARLMARDMRPPMAPPGRPRCAIFLTMVEQFEATVLLARAGLASHGASHVRGMLESLVAFRLLAQKNAHVEQMQYEQLRGEKKLYERVLCFPELVGEERAGIEVRLAECNKRYQALHDKKVRPAKLIEQFEPAGIAQLAAPYIMLCGFAHNDLAALALRHQGDSGLTLRSGDTQEVVFLVLSIAHFSLLDAAAQLGSIALFAEGVFERHYTAMADTYQALMALAT